MGPDGDQHPRCRCANRPPDESVPGTDAVYHLTIKLTRIRPPCWRRLLVPSTATLGHLHRVIQIALEWDDDHLHLFTVGGRRFVDPDFDVEGDEDEMTLGQAFSTRTTLSYVYDLGDDWRHEITLQATRPRDPTTTYPTCTGGRGDSPVEDWIGEGPDSIPFDQAKINNRTRRVEPPKTPRGVGPTDDRGNRRSLQQHGGDDGRPARPASGQALGHRTDTAPCPAATAGT